MKMITARFSGRSETRVLNCASDAVKGIINVSVDGLLQGKIRKDITHWHPDPDEIYDEVIKIGKRGNITVLSSYWGGRALLYSGEKRECPYLPPKKHLLSKYYYIEAK